MKNYFLKIQLLFFFVHIALGLSSQTLDTSEVHRDAKGKVIFARFKEQKAGKGIQQNDIETLKAILNTSVMLNII